MCIAIFKPENKFISDEVLENCWDRNSDGAGFMYTENKELKIEKGFMDFKNFYEAYKKHEEKKAVLHFRIRTHGNTDAKNTHPFEVGKGLGFVHNGIINIDTKSNPNFNDTYHFNTKILHNLYKADNKFIYKPYNEELISKYIGHSKLIFMDYKNRVKIINPQLGDWEDGIWYSNKSYQSIKNQHISKFSTNKNDRITPVINLPWKPLQINSKVYIKENIKEDKRYGTIVAFGNGMVIYVKLDDETYPMAFDGSIVFPVLDTDTIESPGIIKEKFKKGDWVMDLQTEEWGEVAYSNGHVSSVNFGIPGTPAYRFISNKNLEKVDLL